LGFYLYRREERKEEKKEKGKKKKEPIIFAPVHEYARILGFGHILVR